MTQQDKPDPPDKAEVMALLQAIQPIAALLTTLGLDTTLDEADRKLANDSIERIDQADLSNTEIAGLGEKVGISSHQLATLWNWHFKQMLKAEEAPLDAQELIGEIEQWLKNE